MSSTTTSGFAAWIAAIASSALAACPQASAPGMEARITSTRWRRSGESSTRKTFTHSSVPGCIPGVMSERFLYPRRKIPNAQLLEKRGVRAEVLEPVLRIRGEPPVALFDARAEHAAAYCMCERRRRRGNMVRVDSAPCHHAPELQIVPAAANAAPRGVDVRQRGDAGPEEQDQRQRNQQCIHSLCLMRSMYGPGEMRVRGTQRRRPGAAAPALEAAAWRRRPAQTGRA